MIDLTHDQLARFQAKQGISPSGLITAETLAALEGRLLPRGA